MKPNDIIRFMSAQSGMSVSEASRRMGRVRSFISTVINRGSSPRIDTFASICKVFGYKVQVVDMTTGDVIDVD